MKAFVAQAPIAVALTDFELRFLKVSPAWLDDFGASEDQLIGRSSYELAPETRKKYRHLHQRCLAGETVSSEPERVSLPNGKVRWMMWEAAPWRDDEGQVGGLLITSRDVTAQKEAEEELRRTRAFLTTVLENVPAPLIVKDENDRILIMNRAMEELYGAPRDEQLGKRLMEVFDQATVDRINAEDRRVLETGVPMVLEDTPLVTRHNGTRRVRKTKVAIRDGDGPAYLLAISEDITERLKTQEELERTRGFLTAVLEHAPLPMVVTDEEGRVLLMNRAMETQYGEHREESVGKTLYEILPEAVASKVMAEEQQVLSSGEHLVVEEARLIPSLGEVRMLRRTKAPIPGEDGRRMMLTVVEDITERNKTQKELENTRAFLSNLIENVPIPLVLKNAADGRIVMVNRANEQLIGRGREHIVGKTSHELFPAAEAERAIAHDQAVLDSGALMVDEDVPVSTVTNGVRRVRRIKVPVTSPDGAPYILNISEDITERTKTQQELENTRALLSNLIENVPIALVLKDASDGRVVITNKANADLIGREQEDIVGKTVLDLFPEDEARLIMARDREVLETGRLTVEENAVLTTVSGVRQVRQMRTAVLAPDGSPFVLTITEDVTDRRRSAEERERTRAFLQTVIDNVPAALTVKDANDGRLLMCNPAAGIMYGVGAPGTNLGKTSRQVFSPELAARFEQQDRDIVATGETRFFEEEPVDTPEGLRYLNRRKVLIRNPEGSDYLLSIAEDVTERRMAAERLERTRQFLETVINSVPAGITVKDARTGRLVMMNPAVEDIYGVARNENVGKTGEEIFPPGQAEKFARQDREVIASGQSHVFVEDPVWTRNGVRYLNRSKLMIRNMEGEDYLLSISEDVTERKLAQDALREAVDRAEAANVAKSEFLANMSHEIRTPLNGVLGLADALARMKLTPEQREIVELIVGSGKALTAILSDVLDLAKAEAGQLDLLPEHFSLRETIGQAAFLFEAVAQSKGLKFTVAFHADGPDRLVGDPLRIKQVVSNLISNAVKFTSQGEIAVDVRSAAGADGKARLEVSVRDTGPGFSEEVRARLFSRFEQGDGSITRRFGGTGLGLSIAGALAQMMGGDISCSAAPGKGARFVFRAQLEIDQASPAAEAGPRDGSHAAALPDAGRPLRVLLAEDHEVNQKVVQLMLGDAVELVITSDGQQALDAFLGSERFDVILMDTQMPVMDGLTAIGRIREAEACSGRPRTPIVSLTANAMAHQVEASMKAGADAHLAKPITSEGLFGAIQRVLEGVPPGAASETAA
jgi:PAS domain S-box-containing protein